MQIVGKLDIQKADTDRRQVFGFANLSQRRDGQLIVDLQGDVIYPEDLEAAAYRHVKEYRAGGVDHNKRPPIATLIESMFFDQAKTRALGVPDGTVPVGWWVGYEFEDSPDGRAAFESVKSGERSWFSIECRASAQTVTVGED